MPGGRPTEFNNPAVAAAAIQSRRAELLSPYAGSGNKVFIRCLEPQPGGSVCGRVFSKQWSVALRDPVLRCRQCLSPRLSSAQAEVRRPADLAERIRQKGGELLSLDWRNAHTPIEVRCLGPLPSGTVCGQVFKRTPHSLRVSKLAYCPACTNRHIGDMARGEGRLGYSLEKVQAFFAERGAVLQTTDYRNVKQLLDYVCGTPDCGQTDVVTVQAILLSRPDPGDTIQCKDCQNAGRPRGAQSPHYRHDLSDRERGEKLWLRDKPQAIWSRLVRALYGTLCVFDPSALRGDVHHIESWEGYPERRFWVTNGVPMSERFHITYHANWAPKGRSSGDMATFQAFYRDQTGAEFTPILPGLLPEIVQTSEDANPGDLLARKQAAAGRGLLYLPIFPGEAENRRKVVVSMLRNRAGEGGCRIGARKLDLVEMTGVQAREFFGANHVQGHASAALSYALTDGNEIYSAMSFTPLRVPSKEAAKGGWEMVRMAHKAGWLVPGAASRLLRAFRRQYPTQAVTTYADRRFCAVQPEDTVYPQLGFQYSHASRPSYRYTNRDGTLLFNKKSFQRKHLPARLGDLYDPTKSEAVNMRAAGYYRLWDCGTFVFHLSE